MKTCTTPIQGLTGSRIALMASTSEVPSGRTNPDIVELSIAVVSGLALALTALFICSAPLSGQISGARDFVSYWATGQQLVHHASPYDPAAMMQIERAALLPPEYGVIYMRNPPWALPLVWPLGLIGMKIGTLLWSLTLLACLLGSVWTIWRLHGRPKNYLHWLGLSFAPALICLIAGQTALFALLGLVLFLRLHRTRPFLAGMALWLCALKPHLFVPFGLVLVVWIVVSKSYRILAGAGVALAASCGAAYCMFPNAWAEYPRMLRSSGIEMQFIPCLSIVLRLLLSPHSAWLQYVPVSLACIWALAYFWPRRNTWDWGENGSPLMLVSLFLAPYCWLFDQALAIPALLHGVYVTKSKAWLAVLAFASVLLVFEAGSGLKLPSAYHLWTAPAWLAWYLVARATGNKPQALQSPAQ